MRRKDHQQHDDGPRLTVGVTTNGWPRCLLPAAGGDEPVARSVASATHARNQRAAALAFTIGRAAVNTWGSVAGWATPPGTASAAASPAPRLMRRARRPRRGQPLRSCCSSSESGRRDAARARRARMLLLVLAAPAAGMLLALAAKRALVATMRGDQEKMRF